MNNDMNTAVRLILDDKFSGGIKDAGENVKDFSEDTKKSTKDVNTGLDKASQSSKKFGDSAQSAGKKAESGFRAAGSAMRNFTDGAKTAVGVIDKAFSGTGAALATLGVSFSVGSAVNECIKFDDKLTRIGLTADASAEQISNLKDKIFDAALNSDIKVDTTSIADALDVVMTKTGDLTYAESNIKNIATAIKATGESGDAIGSVFAEFSKFGYSAEEITALMDDMVKQGDQGAFTFGEFAKAGSAIISAYSPIGTAPENIKKANAAMQILTAGMKDPTAAVTGLSSLMSDLSSADKQQKLKNMFGISVRDEGTGAFRDLNDIMADCLVKIKEMGNADAFTEIFGDNAFKGLQAYQNHYERMYEGLTNLGETTGALQGKAATMSGTLASNLKNLQTAFVRFADINLSKPLEKFTDLLNKLAENKAVYQGIFTGLAALAGAIGTIKIASGVSRFVKDFMNLKNGGGANINIGSNIGGQGMPVYVTNWGGQAGSSQIPTAQNGQPSVPAQAGAAAKGFKGKMATAGSAWKTAAKGTAIKAGGTAAAFAALEAVPQMAAEWKIANEDETLTNKQKGKAKGGAVGAAAGKVVGAGAGAWAGAAAGAAIGSVVPVIGTAIGGVIGAGVGALAGYFGGKGGRWLGEKIGEGLAKDDSVADKVSDDAQRKLVHEGEISSENLPSEVTNQYMTATPKYTGQTMAELKGEAAIDVNVTVENNMVAVDTSVKGNTINNTRFNTGRLQEARSY